MDKLELPHRAYMLPEAIPNWPPVWWFWLVVMALLCVAFSLGVYVLSRRKRSAYRREALQELEQLSSALHDREFIAHCLALIKRCLMTEDRGDLTSLMTLELFTLLDSREKNIQLHLTPLADLFNQTLYQPNVKLSAAQKMELLQTVSKWLRHHHA